MAPRLALRLDSGTIYKVVLLSLFLQTIQPVGAEGTPVDAARRSLAAAVIAPDISKSLSSTKTTGLSKPVSKTSYSKKAIRSKVGQSYPRTHMEMGFYLKQKNDPNGALLEFLKATQADPHQVRGFYEQALIFRARGYRKLAESSLGQALAIDPKYNDARILLATVRLEQGNWGGAVQELSRSLGLDSSNDSSKDSSKDFSKDSSIDRSKDSNTDFNKNSNKDTSKDSVNSGNADSFAAASAASQQSSGLLSIDVPAILQSIHGVIKTPSWLESLTGMAPSATPTPSASSSTSSEHKDAQKGETEETAGSSPGKVAGLDTNSVASEIDQSEVPGKKKHKKSKPKKNKQEKQEKEEKKNKKDKKGKKDKREKTEKAEKSLLVPGASSESNTDSDTTAAQNSQSQQKVTEITTPIEPKSTPSNANNDDDDILANIKREANFEITESKTEKAPAVAFKQKAPAGDGPAFNVSKNIRPVTSILNNILSTASQGQSSPGEKQPPATPKVKLDDDDWAKKLKNYAEHGANSLKNGEAFMFSEDTGEASLFLADGTTIRRIVAQPQDSNEVIRERRPDISHAEDVLYGLSLLGKLIPKFDTTPVKSTESVAMPTPEAAGNFRGDNLMTSTQSFWGWLKSVCKF